MSREEVWRVVRRRGHERTGEEGNVVFQRSNNFHRQTKYWRSGAGRYTGEVKPLSRSQRVTFFFNNIPEDCSFDFLRRKFGAIRVPTDIFCPNKRDKKGKPFGFVRFEGVEDTEGLLEQLNQLWIGSYKIRVFKPRFERVVRDEEKKGFDAKRVSGKKPECFQFLDSAKKKPGVSFKEVLTGVSKGETCTREKLQFKTSEEDSKWLEGTFTGFIKDDFSWDEIKEEINSECAGKLKVSTMGGSLVLIRSICELPTQEVLTELDEWSDFWFLWKRKWNFVDVHQQRAIWTRWIGIPLHAWNSRFFDSVTANFGRVLKSHELTKEKEKLDEALIQISTGLKSIDQVLECCIDGASFTIRIEEIHDNPLSSLFGEPNLDESESESDSGWSDGAESLDPAIATIGMMDDIGVRDGDVSVLQELNSSIPSQDVSDFQELNSSIPSQQTVPDTSVEVTNHDETTLGGSRLLLNVVAAEGLGQSSCRAEQEDCLLWAENSKNQDKIPSGNLLEYPCEPVENFCEVPLSLPKVPAVREKETILLQGGTDDLEDNSDSLDVTEKDDSSGTQAGEERLPSNNKRADPKCTKGKKGKRKNKNRATEKENWGRFISEIEPLNGRGEEAAGKEDAGESQKGVLLTEDGGISGQKIWDFGKKLGLSSQTEEEEIVRQIEMQGNFLSFNNAGSQMNCP